MKLVPLYRNVFLLTGLLLSGIAAIQTVDWPRQITDSRGTHTPESQPRRMVSTNIILTGPLLAIDAPAIASDATTPNNHVTDDQGFLRQWSEMAKEHKLQRLHISEPNAEAAVAQVPDPVLISTTGGDSALALYDQSSTIAPILVTNYGDKGWQSLLTQLDETTRHEKQTAEWIVQFNRQLAVAKERIKLPPQSVIVIVYTAAAHSVNLWTPESAQEQMLEQLGFTLMKLPTGLNASQSRGKRHDIIQLGGKNLTAGLNGGSLFLPAGDQKDADVIYANPLFAYLSTVQDKQVYMLGVETFRLDYYSIIQVLDGLKALF